jgi:ABC-2 type transport system ATP-binding protein
VRSAERHGGAVALSCADADTALRVLLQRYPGARDIEVRGGSLEEAFMELTAAGASGSRNDNTKAMEVTR